MEQMKGVELFVCTAEAGSFIAAAERLHLTSSAVSKGVARLEARLGARLFDRTTRRLRLTDAGQAYYRTCAAVLAELTQAENMLAAQTIEPTGRLRIDLPASFGRSQVMPHLLAFADLHPKVRLDVSFTDRFVDLIEEGVDVAVRIGGPSTCPPGLGRRPLGVERLIFCAAPAYLKRRGKLRVEADLFKHAGVLYRKSDGSGSAWILNRDDAPAERRTPEGALLLGSAEAQVSAVVAGAGVAQLATWLIKEALAERNVIEVLPGLSVAGLPLSLAWPLDRQLLPKVSALLAYLSLALTIK